MRSSLVERQENMINSDSAGSSIVHAPSMPVVRRDQRERTSCVRGPGSTALTLKPRSREAESKTSGYKDAAGENDDSGKPQSPATIPRYATRHHQQQHQHQNEQRQPPIQQTFCRRGIPMNMTVALPSDDSGVSPTSEPMKKKQKRNKPTLSCFECVERKTKTAEETEWSNTSEPGIKRQTDCGYAVVANLLVNLLEETSRKANNGLRMTRVPKRNTLLQAKPSPSGAFEGVHRNFTTTGRTVIRGSVALSTGLLSNVPFSEPGASNVFGIGSEHPFANYWTHEGGLQEVIGVLPDKPQADTLMVRYFECVDPVYPMMHRQTFYAEYAHLWPMSLGEIQYVDPAFVALVFVMLALGTQFVTSTPAKARKHSAELFASASNQALRIASYMSTASTKSIQAMVLITYFLINDNHASDGWAFAGILMRQAYAMALHRDPNIVTPTASLFEKQQRRKVWQAVLLQDTFLTVLLSLPPNATHTDVSVDDLIEGDASIASDDPADVAYLRGSWTLANLVQETICSPRSLDMPVCATPRHKSKLVADFRVVYHSFPELCRSRNPDILAQQAMSNKRIVRQTLFLTSNYFHNLMLVYASQRPDVPVNVRGTLEAAHDAITAFFVLFNLFEAEAKVWWACNHRAFLEALCTGEVLRELLKDPEAMEMSTKDPLLVRARADISRMSQIMQIMAQEGSETARTRVQVLSDFL